MPSSRYQHGAVFVAGRLHISGGAVGGGRMVEDETVGVVLDTAAGCWCPLESQPAAGDDWMRRSALSHSTYRLMHLPAALPACICFSAWMCGICSRLEAKFDLQAVGAFG